MNKPNERKTADEITRPTEENAELRKENELLKGKNDSRD